jgi:cyclopropane fatty-acyl-phospholipid synthase-like methyltransferase
MNPNKALWEKGDFTKIAASMRDSGEELVGRLGITKGLKVMDLGCGDGTTAVPAARLGAEVLALCSGPCHQGQSRGRAKMSPKPRSRPCAEDRRILNAPMSA